MVRQVNGVLALSILSLAALSGQSPKDDVTAQQKKDDLTNAATAGTPLPATINVRDNCNIEAVMLPHAVSRRVFGKEVADNYAVVEINISNRSNDAALIVQSLFIDIHEWGLAGPVGSGLGAGGVSRSPQNLPFQVKANPWEVSSVEYRIVRGELLDRQPWTSRNVALRSIQALGSIGTSFAFPFTKDVVAGIGAWNGGVVPGFQSLFPDGTIAQLDRISDFGFRNNKVIPQQAADILVAFFPIRRFLTPGLERAFLETPSVFFNPLLMIIDPKSRKYFEKILDHAFGSKEEVDKQFTALLAAYATLDQADLKDKQDRIEEYSAPVTEWRATVEQARKAVDQDAIHPDLTSTAAEGHKKALQQAQDRLSEYETSLKKAKQELQTILEPLTTNKLYNLLSTFSLNNVHIVVSGIMTIDIDNVPPVITSITCTGDDKPATLWSKAGDVACAIHGSFLSNGTPVIAEASDLEIDAGAVATGSTDNTLNIKLTLKKAISPKKVLTFQVTKKNKQGNTVESMKFPYTIPDSSSATPSITGVTYNDPTITVNGANLDAAALTVALQPVAPSTAAPITIDKPVQTASKITFDSKSLAPGCWLAQIKVGTAAIDPSKDKPPKDQFAVETPTIAKATLSGDGTQLTVSGQQLLDLTACGGKAITATVLSNAANAKPQNVTKSTLASDGSSATLTLPVLTKTAKWKSVQILLDGKDVKGSPLQLSSAISK